MTKDEITRGINLSFEAMLYAQMLIDAAVTTRERGIAAAIYEAHHALYLVLSGDRYKEKRRDEPPGIGGNDG